MKDIPLFSIITPSYNQGAFIEDTLIAVKNQNYPNIEHIIIDGGSTDDTLDILRKYEGTYNMRWISEPDEGQADAINKGFRMAKGEIITWLNSDDYYMHNEVISTVASYFNLYKSAHVVTGSGYFVNEKGTYLSPIIFRKEHVNLQFMRHADFMLQPSTFFKRDVIETLTLDKQYVYAFDWLFFIKIFEMQFNVLAVDDYFSAYRIHSNHKTGEDNAARKKEISEIIRRNYNVFYPQTIYCYIIYWLYLFAELFPDPIRKQIKYFIKICNYIIGKITYFRLISG